MLATIVAAPDAWAQTFPAKPLRIVLPFGAGGATDTIARSLGQKLSEGLGQAVVIDNRPGAGGAIATEAVARAPADGYTLLMATSSTHAILPSLNPKLSYDPVKDFAAVGLVARAPNILIVSPTVKASSVRELVDAARPGTFAFASSGSGTINHLIGEMFIAAVGTKATHVPYKTGVQAVPDLLSGQVAFMFDSIVWTLPQIRAGKLRGLAITSDKRSPLAPELPTVAESGIAALAGFDGTTWFGLMAPAATAGPILTRLHAELQQALASPDLRDRLTSQGAEAAPGSRDAFAALIRADTQKWANVIRAAGVKLE